MRSGSPSEPLRGLFSTGWHEGRHEEPTQCNKFVTKCSVKYKQLYELSYVPAFVPMLV